MTNKLLNRREFIHIITVLSTAYPLSSLASTRNNHQQTISDKEPWRTIVQVQEHLFPSRKISPGAADIHALTYLQNMMRASDFDDEKKTLIYNSSALLNKLAKQHYRQQFMQLNTHQKEKTLRRLENTDDGSYLLSILLTNILEALLSDPIYAGNPNGIGWKWLNHQPGFPLPTKNKKYYQLRKQRIRITKA